MWKQYYTKLITGIVFTLVSPGAAWSADGVLEVVVSFDGTRMTRRHNSLIVFGFVMDVNNGFVLDVEVLSDFCHKKEQWL